MSIIIYSKPHNIPIKVDSASYDWPSWVDVPERISSKLGSINKGDVFDIKLGMETREFKVKGIQNKGSVDESVSFVAV